MAIPLADLITWLEPFVSPIPVVANFMASEPDAQVVLNGGAGAAPTQDGAFEPGHIHIRCRGTTDELAEATALAVHAALVSLSSTQMGGTWVVSAESAAGPPSFLMRDTSQRSVYIATYLFVTPTAIG